MITNTSESGRDATLLGAFLFGIGLIAMIDGIHRVRPLAFHPLPYDLAFDASALLFLWLGWMLYREMHL